MKKTTSAVATLVVAAAVIGAYFVYKAHQPQGIAAGNRNAGTACTEEAKICPDGSSVGRVGPDCQFAECPSPSASFENIAYTIDGTPITLAGGVSTGATAAGSATEITTKYFGDSSTGDLNGDGIPDTAFILTQNAGGSGTFYYAVAALGGSGAPTGTNAVFLGDRILPQSTSIANGVLTVNYKDRAANDPMSSAPTVTVIRNLTFANGTLADTK